MSAPFCPLLMAARAQAPKLILDGVEGKQASAFAAITDGVPLFPDPTQAPGVACVGSRCAWWRRGTEDRTKGRCGQAETWHFPDPADQAGGAA